MPEVPEYLWTEVVYGSQFQCREWCNLQKSPLDLKQITCLHVVVLFSAWCHPKKDNDLFDGWHWNLDGHFFEQSHPLRTLAAKFLFSKSECICEISTIFAVSLPVFQNGYSNRLFCWADVVTRDHAIKWMWTECQWLLCCHRRALRQKYTTLADAKSTISGLNGLAGFTPKFSKTSVHWFSTGAFLLCCVVHGVPCRTQKERKKRYDEKSMILTKHFGLILAVHKCDLCPTKSVN